MIVVEGLEEARAYLTSLSDLDWQGPLEAGGRSLVRFAASISPVVTGSYAGAHRATVDGKTLTLSIDPMARNKSVPVTRYAGAVEERHQVYARSAVQGVQIGAQVLEDILKKVGL